MDDFIESFNPNELVIELLEDIEITQTLVDRIIELKLLGYKIAMDDFILMELTSLHEKLFLYIDYIKIDFMLTSSNQRSIIEANIRKINPTIKLLAEKVETYEEYEEAIQAGYSLFQGYFFQKPELVISKEIPANTMQYFSILSILESEEPDIHEIAEHIEQDVSLTFKLLNLVNRMNIRVRTKITSIRQAIILLGLVELEKWIAVLVLHETNRDDADVYNELIAISLFRAKVCEQIARFKGLPNHAEYFLVGMFSNIDSILQKPIEVIMEQMPFSEQIKATILNKDTDMLPYLKLSISLNSLNWEQIEAYCNQLNIPAEQIELIYYNSLAWVDQVMQAQHEQYQVN